ncbi:hypothetical protein J4734_27230 [Klebsiella pneumoniae]|uniref:Uncharacterized protein n=1 Tax=Klebsiella pneumoniae TaxID=573 RepID=A0A939SVS7_KLEPN|nr:hypothetical protein [Klebsiella pneumoniae]
MAEGPICASANKMINGWFPKSSGYRRRLSQRRLSAGRRGRRPHRRLRPAFGWRPAL